MYGSPLMEYCFLPGAWREPLDDAVDLVGLVGGGPDLCDDDVAVEAAVELGAVALLAHQAVLLPVVQPVPRPACKKEDQVLGPIFIYVARIITHDHVSILLHFMYYFGCCVRTWSDRLMEQKQEVLFAL